MRHREYLIGVGETLRMLRERSGLSQEKVALIAELDRTTVGRWERAERGIAFTHLLQVLAAMGSDFMEFAVEMDKRDAQSKSV